LGGIEIDLGQSERILTFVATLIIASVVACVIYLYAMNAGFDSKIASGYAITSFLLSFVGALMLLMASGQGAPDGP